MDPSKLPPVVPSADLEQMFARARRDLDDPSRLDAIASRLGPELSGSSSPSPTAGGDGASRGPWLARIAGLGVVTGAAAIMLYVMGAGSAPGPAPRAAGSPRAAESKAWSEPPSTPPPALPATPAASDSELAPDVAPRHAPLLRAPSRPRPAPSSTQDRSDAVVEEHALLARARRALDSDPAEALARVDEHARRFPGGELASEREFLRVAALSRLGRAGDARAARDAFVARWPSSAYRREVERLTAP